jgi:hypothetical protein
VNVLKAELNGGAFASILESSIFHRLAFLPPPPRRSKAQQLGKAVTIKTGTAK